MGLNSNFGQNLKLVRESKKITQVEFAKMVGCTKGAVSQWECGVYMPNSKTIEKICEVLEIEPADLYNEHYIKSELGIDDVLRKITVTKVPVLGNIACGEPMFAESRVEFYVDALNGIKADFAVVAKGDSMIDARINDGDLVFIKKQEMVENGEIAAVLIENEATLKRFYFDRNTGTVTLMPANAKYQPFVFLDDEVSKIKILGKAVAFQSIVS